MAFATVFSVIWCYMVLKFSCYSRDYQSVVPEPPMVPELHSDGQQNWYTNHIKVFIPSIVRYCITIVKQKAEK
jgi:hypothetical protein